MEFKAGRVRKNATKRINWLLENAKTIAFETQSMALDDCFDSNGEKIVNIKSVKDWMAKERNQRDLQIYVKLDNEGVIEKATIGGQYYWSDIFTLSFKTPQKELKKASNRFWAMESQKSKIA